MITPVTFLSFCVITLLTTSSSFSALPDNVLVNIPAADLTFRDTQNGTAIVRGAGNSVIIAFNDSGSQNGANNHFADGQMARRIFYGSATIWNSKTVCISKPNRV